MPYMGSVVGHTGRRTRDCLISDTILLRRFVCKSRANTNNTKRGKLRSIEHEVNYNVLTSDNLSNINY